jgi:hypothetical protein
MNTRRAAAILGIASLALLGQACATPEQWNTWRSHNTHFASGQHMGFSLRNPGAEAERVKVTDPAKSKQESWWGRQLPLAAGQPAGGS